MARMTFTSVTSTHEAGVDNDTMWSYGCEQGEWRIEAVELHRVYPPVQTREAHSEQAHQDALIAELRTALADMRQGRDEWREQATLS